MRRVTRKDRWGKWTNNQETRWVGSRQIDMRAHGKLKSKTKPCAHTKQKHKHMASKTNHQPCAKQDTNMQLMRILIKHVFTQNMTTWKHAAHEIHKLCHTAQDTWTGERTAERTQDRTLTQQDRTWSTSVQTPTRTKSQDMSTGIQTPRSNTKQGTQTRERTARAH